MLDHSMVRASLTVLFGRPPELPAVAAVLRESGLLAGGAARGAVLPLDIEGLAQLDLPDLEAYAAGGAGAKHVAEWLRMVALHLAQAEAPLVDGDTLDGPDEEPWMTQADAATVEPGRQVLRFVPLSSLDRE